MTFFAASDHASRILSDSRTRGYPAATTAGPSFAMRNGIATINVHGPLVHRADEAWPGMTSYESIRAGLRAALAGSARTIVLDIDSPGGALAGLFETAAEIYRARNRKRIIASVNAHAESAAFLLASAASEVTATPSAMVGGIGIANIHEDYTRALSKAGIKISVIRAGKNKWAANPFEPLSDAGRAEMQNIVDGYNRDLIRAVARYRGRSVAFVESNFGNGSMFKAEEALKRGMIDRIETPAATVARLTGNSTNYGRAAMLRRAELDTLDRQKWSSN